MALIVKCPNPDALLQEINNLIREKKIETWLIDGDGDFTHSPTQWKNAAWFRPKINEGELKLNIIGNKEKKMSKISYGIYHGRFIEMLLNHFDTMFSEIICTALAKNGDNIGGSSSA